MKKIIYILVFTFLFILTGCGEKQLMDVPAEDGKYHYNNEMLSFSLTLPKEFEYYQTQRIDVSENNTELEFFVPTSDKEYINAELPSYGKPMVIGVFKESYWNDNSKEKERYNFEKIGQKGDKIYAIRFWKDLPQDWKAKWSINMEKEIKDSFKINN